MGESSFVKTKNYSSGVPLQGTGEASSGAESSKEAAFTRQAVRGRAGVDWLLVGSSVGLTLFGLVMVYSAGPKFAPEPDYFLWRQMLWAGVGLVVAAVLWRIDYHWLRRLSVIMILVTLAALALTVFLGNTTLGANRSLLSGSVRPSELAKVVIIIYVSVWLNSKREILNDMSLGLIPMMIILGLTAGLILLQPDLSAAITVVVLGCILFFLAGGEWRQIALVLVITVLVGWVMINVSSTGKQRMTDYLAGLHDPLNASYHVERSFEAIIKGGAFGVGIGNSSTKYTGLPVAYTDSIFAVITEETGMLGAGLVIAAYLVILWRGIAIAQRATDQLGMLLASGMTIWIVIEALLNMAVMVNLLPQAGNALPFISYGGSSLVATIAAVGILLSVSRSSNKKEKGGKTFGAVVDLRWRDRRGSVSRTGRSSGTR